MGLSNSNSNKKFITIVNCAFCLRVKPETDGAEKRILEKGKNAGREIWELRYSNLEGLITGLNCKESDYGDVIEIELTDRKEKYVLQISFENFSMRDAIVKRLPNIDYSSYVTFSVFPDKETGRTVLILRQADQIVPFHFTKDNPNGMPQATKRMIRGKEQWDFAEIEDFLYKVLQKEILRFQGDNKDTATTPDESHDGILGDDEAPF